jgi:hypothetical protein
MSAGGWFDDIGPKDRLKRLTGEADADRAAATAARQPARRRTGRLARTLKTRWWPRVLAAGTLLVIIGATTLSGAAEVWVVAAGAAFIVALAIKSLSMSPNDYSREPPMPPGAPPPGGGWFG